MQPLQDDMIWLNYVEDGTVKVLYVRLKFGDAVLFPTTTYHFGVSNKQVCGHDLAPPRRRVFWDLDAKATNS